jgi:hypothetical protein
MAVEKRAGCRQPFAEGFEDLAALAELDDTDEVRESAA